MLKSLWRFNPRELQWFYRSWIAIGLTLATGVAGADPLMDEIIERGVARIDQSQTYQKKIDRVDDQIRDRVSEYKSVNKEIEGLEVYIAQLQKQINSQKTEMTDLNESIDKVTLIERNITPLMLKMIEGLERFVALDLPFLVEERKKRVAKLSTMMSRSDVSTAEKFRHVLQAYQSEIEFGRTIEAYRGPLSTSEQNREVDFLRVGRIALMYQTLDGSESGLWNDEKGQWEALPRAYQSQIEKGLRIAKSQAAPALIRLPLNAPKEIK